MFTLFFHFEVSVKRNNKNDFFFLEGWVSACRFTAAFSIRYFLNSVGLILRSSFLLLLLDWDPCVYFLFPCIRSRRPAIFENTRVIITTQLKYSITSRVWAYSINDVKYLKLYTNITCQLNFEEFWQVFVLHWSEQAEQINRDGWAERCQEIVLSTNILR